MKEFALLVSIVCAMLMIIFVGCSPVTLSERVGRPIPQDMPQATEQCRAQPNLAWCKP